MSRNSEEQQKNLKKGPFTRFLVLLILILPVWKTSFLEAQEIDSLNVESELSITLLLSEISGMCPVDDNIYAINDGGNGPYIFILDPATGNTRDNFRIRNIENNDWEELSFYKGYFYIGDFGNNRGKRKDLMIHRISIDSIRDTDPSITSTKIAYRNQESFKKSRHHHDWDCEAMIINENGIFLFSKSWLTKDTKLYRIDTEGSLNNLSPVDSFKTGFLVTGAYYHGDKDNLYLCGYYEKETFLMVFRKTNGNGFSENYSKYIIPELYNAQIESVFVKDNHIYLASERKIKPQAIYKISLSDIE